eukprot:TRINITY_DN673_c0_g1_i1.p1 TRINITY_DN673_c0_g1~~TRINITY_DN673_c0_g1_i1.p1  ORF type:complete len:786 (+),score=10.78 TRINITY_DN673_c0_g1_i1:62-2419(+)
MVHVDNGATRCKICIIVLFFIVEITVAGEATSYSLVQTAILCTKATLSIPRTELAAASVSNKVLFAGGNIIPGGPSSRVDIFDSTTDSWTTAELSEPKNGLSASVIGTKIIFGQGNSPSSLIDIFDAGTNVWTNISSPQKHRGCATSIGDLTIFTRPTADNGGNSIVDIYNIVTNTWSTHKIAGSGPRSCVTIGDKVILTAGETTVVDIYDAKEATWSTAHLNQDAPYSQKLISCALSSMVLFAGMSEVADIYNANNNSWTTTTFPTPRVHHASASLENRYCLFAGGMNPIGGAVYSIVNIYDSITNQWTINQLGKPSMHLASTSMGNLALFGGGETTADHRTVSGDIYIFETKTFNISLSNLTAHTGDTVTFNVTFIKGMTYEWRKNNVIWPWSSSNILTTLPLVINDDQSYYQVFLSDLCGNVHASNIVFITVTQPKDEPITINTPIAIPTINTKDESDTSIWIFISIGVVAVIIIAVVVWIVTRQKKALANSTDDQIPLMEDEEEFEEQSTNDTRVPILDVPFSEIIIGDKLGEGSFGEIFKGKWNGQNIALKKLKSTILDLSGINGVLEEAKTLISLRHKHIVLSMGVTTNPETNEILIVMEYMKNRSLDDLLFKDRLTLSRSEVVQLALDIAKGLNYLHCLTPKIIHRDLKSANVLLYHDKKRAKVSDFGTARFLHSSSAANTVIGTFGFIAPEVLQESPYTEKADVYSFGALLFEMMTNTHLPVIFEEHNRIKKIEELVSDPQLKDLIVECCRADPNSRPTIRHCIDTLKCLKSLTNKQ